MKKALYVAGAILLLLSCSHKTRLVDIADAVIAKAPSCLDYGHYAGTVFTHGLAEYTLLTGCGKDLTESIARSFAGGEAKGYGSFICYETGSTMLPLMACNGAVYASNAVSETAARMWTQQPRNEDGLMVPPWCDPSKNPLFIDCVLAVTPYFLYAGLLEDNQEYIDYAARMTLDTFRELRDPETGLVNQARGVMWMERGQKTTDCWSRGNGWGSIALGVLLKSFPKDNPLRGKIDALAKDFFSAAVRFQDSDGLWHQEMTFADSYPEISGTGLLLYGLGRAIEAGVLDRKEYLPAFRKGIGGMLMYVDADGNIGNTCSGCLAWGDGGKEAYAAHEYYCNEPHAFGPVLLALTEAIALGINEVKTELGSRLEGMVPACHVRFVPERKGDIAWENDRAAFRIYSQEVKEKVSSGIDYWGKRVDYPIVEHWYELNGRGLEYHVDRGQGRDFYAVGRNRGIGGTGVWTGKELLVPEPYIGYKILKDGPEELAFSVEYPEIPCGEGSYKLTETIEMVLGTPFFKKTVGLETVGNVPRACIAVGLTDFGGADVRTDSQNAALSLFEDLGADGKIASAVVADPASFAGFASAGKDRLILLSPDEASCFVGVAWDGDIRWRNLPGEWYRLLGEGCYDRINKLY